MAIQYYMRGYNIGTPGAVGYVDWVVNDTPDSLAIYVPSPYSSANITNITVNKTITSKVDNFLKPFESLTAIGGTGNDGYFFHLNSYDWLHATPPGPPIPVPSYLTGLSIVRGSSNGITPRDYATLFWAENALKWLFAYNTNGNGQTIGAALPVGMGSLSIDGYIEIGTNPAQSGIIRIPNNQFLVSRNDTNTSDGYLIGQDNLNRVRLGSAPGNQIYIPANLRVDGYIRDNNNPSLSGFIRNSNATPIITFRNLLNSSDILALSSTSGNLIVLGDAVNSGMRFNVADGYEHIFQVNSTNLLRIGNIGGITYENFENIALSPTISQFNTAIGNGQNITFKAQDTTSIGGIGGSTIISSGHGLNADGYVDLRINNIPKIRVFGSAVPVTADLPNNSGSNPNSIQIISPTIRWYDTISNPTIIQDQISVGDGQLMTIQAQNATGTNTIGGNLRFKSGTGTTIVPISSLTSTPYLRNGRIFFEAGSITNNIGEFGVDGYGPYFSVGGTTSLPASIDGYLRVPNNTWALASTRNPATAPLASIHLIGTNSTNQLLIGDVSNSGIIFNTATNSVYDFKVNATSNKIQIGDGYIRSGSIPASTGIFRNSQISQVVTDIITSRNVANTNDLRILGVDGYNRILMGASGLNTGFIFNTSSGNIFDFQVGGVSNKVIVGDGYIRLGTTPASTGNIRNTQTANVATDIITSRNFANTNDLKLLGVDGYDRITHGLSALNKGHIFDTAIDGYYDFRVNGAPSAFIDLNKFAFKVGRRRHVTPVSTTYQVLVTDDFLAVTASSIYTITLPASPELGDTYEFKDINGTAAVNNITVNGNGNNIDGIPTLVINTNFAAFVVTYTGSQWSVS